VSIRISSPGTCTLVVTAVGTGLHQGELIGLTVPAVGAACAGWLGRWQDPGDMPSG